MVLLARLLVLAAAVGGALLACSSKSSDVADGAACSEPRECVSGECMDGYCQGKSGCSAEDAGGDCQPGWTCVRHSGGLLGSSSTQCEATCGHCPAAQHCPALGKDDVTTCAPGAPRTVTIAGPETVKPGISSTFTLAIEPGVDLGAYDWHLLDEGEVWPPEPGRYLVQTPAPSLTWGFENAVALREGVVKRLYVHGEVRRGPERAPDSIHGVRDIRLVCAARGEDCTFEGACCEDGSRCERDASSGRASCVAL